MTDETVYKAQEKIKLNTTNSSLIPWLLIGGGVVLLLARMFDVHLIDFLWPGFIIIPGLLLMYPAYKSTADETSGWSFLAVPGTMIVATGVLLFIMNLFNHFEAWAYVWPMIPAAAAAGVLYFTRYDGNSRLEQRAHKFIRVMVMLMVGLAFFFEIVVFENFNPLMSLGLIFFGLYLLVQDRKAVKATA
jgi:hypothetical protein